MDISGISFVQGQSTFDSSIWSGGSDARVTLRAGDCFQIWSPNFTSLPASEPPANICKRRQSLRQTNKTFWIGSDSSATFDVRLDNRVIATCPTGISGSFTENRCIFPVSGIVTAVPTSSPTIMPVPSDTPAPTNTPTATVTNTPTATSTPTPIPTESLDFTEGAAQVLLRYDGRTLVLFNRSNTSVDIRSLSFVQVSAAGDGATFQTSDWAGNLQSLRAGGCYQVWTTDIAGLPADEPPATECKSRAGFRSTRNVFWISNDGTVKFEVRRGSDVLAVCPVSRVGTFIETRCAVDVRR
jgi:hypothetical protein